MTTGEMINDRTASEKIERRAGRICAKEIAQLAVDQAEKDVLLGAAMRLAGTLVRARQREIARLLSEIGKEIGVIARKDFDKKLIQALQERLAEGGH